MFEQGDYVYVENIEHSIPSNGPHLSAIGIGTTTNKSEDSYVGSGWNSADYDFKFFRVKEFNNTKKLYDFLRMLDAPDYPNAFIEFKKFKFVFNDVKFNSKKIKAKVQIFKNEK